MSADVVIIAGDTPLEVLGKQEREKFRLTMDGIPAALPFLQEYFRNNRNPAAALTALRQHGLSFVSLNGPYLVQFLEQAGFSTALIPVFSEQKTELLDLLARKPAAVVISTTFLPFAAQIDAMAAFIKQHCPTTTVIAGGIQIWKSHKHKLRLDEGLITPDIRDAVCTHNYLMDPTRPSPVDVFVVSASGETTLAQLLERIRAGQDYRSISNIAWFENGRWAYGPMEPEPYHEVKVDWGRFPFRPPDVYVPIQAGLGCGFRCAFCDFQDLRPIHTRSCESIVNEIRTIPPHGGIRRVYFTDDNLFPSRKRAVEVCRELVRANLGMKWRGLIRISIVDDEVAELMAKSGCLEVLLGIESGDPDILQRMNKRTTPDEILRGIDILTRHGINTKSTFIVGFPGETDRSIQNTIQLLNAYPTSGPAAHRFLFFTYAVLPLSTVATPESRTRYRLKGYGYDWSHETMTAKEAAAKMESIHDAVKPELSPNYVLEIPELAGLTVDNIKQVYRVRNRIARLRRGLPETTPESDLWNQLAKEFKVST